MNIQINLDNLHDEMVRKITGHVASMRTVLRSIEDGTYKSKGTGSAPGSILNWHFPDLEQRLAEHAQDEIGKTLLRVVSAFIDFLDTMIAIIRIREDGIPVTRDLHGDEEISKYAEAAFGQAVQEVARDTALTNPKKIRHFVGLSGFSQQAADSYFALRRCIEHHKAIAQERIDLVYQQFAISVDGRDIDRLPYDVAKGQKLEMRRFPVERRFEPGSKVMLTEREVEQIAFTLTTVVGPQVIGEVQAMMGGKAAVKTGGA